MSVSISVVTDFSALRDLAKDIAALEAVPEKVAARQDVKNNLETIAKITLLNFGIDETGTAMANIKAATTQDGTGIEVYEALNAATRSKYGADAGKDPYILFFLEEYAPQSFLKMPGSNTKGGDGQAAVGRDFFALWPALMLPNVVDAIHEEVGKALK